MTATRSTAAAFTLIELMVVVAIIVALIAILLPSLGKAVSVSHTAVCGSNVRQIALAHTGYAADHRGIHPPSSTQVGEPHWLALMHKYLSDSDSVRFCPETDGYNPGPTQTGVASRYGSRTQTWWLKENSYGVGFYGGGSYGVNIFTHSTSGWSSPIDKHFRTVKDARFPHNSPLMADSVWHNGYPRDNDTAPNTEPTTISGISNMGRFMLRRHHDGVNVAMLDTSVRRTDLPDMWTLDWHQDFQRKSDVVVPYLND